MGYGKTSEDAIRKRINEINSQGGKYIFKDGIDVLKLSKGENALRIMPPFRDGDFYGTDIWVHGRVGLDDESFICKIKTKIGDSCAACDHQKELRAAGADDEDIKALFPKRRVLFNVVNLAEIEKGVQVFNCPSTLGDEIVRQSIDPDSGEILDVSDPLDGYNIYITREGEGLTTKYVGVRIARKPSPIPSESFLDGIRDLNTVYNVSGDEEIRTAIAGSYKQDAKQNDPEASSAAPPPAAGAEKAAPPPATDAHTSAPPSEKSAAEDPLRARIAAKLAARAGK